MANDFARLTAAVTSVGEDVAAVAAAIKNPPAGGNDQAVLDELATRLEEASAVLKQAVIDENIEDS